MSFDDYFFNAQNSDTIAKKLDVLNHNARKARELKSTIGEMKALKTLEEGKQEEVVKPRKINDENFKEPLDVDLELERLYEAICNLNIKGLNEEKIADKINSILREYVHVESLISKLKLRFFYDIVQYSEFILHAESREEIREVQEIIETFKIKIGALLELKQEEELVESTIQDNNLFFLMTDMGNVIFSESLRQDIPQDRNSQALGLLMQIKQGIFKGFKSLAPKPFFEVRDDDIRILFAKLSKGNYIIVDVILKKEVWSQSYQEYLFNRAKQYLMVKDYYIEHLTDEKFVEMHSGIYDDITSLCRTQDEDFGGRHNG